MSSTTSPSFKIPEVITDPFTLAFPADPSSENTPRQVPEYLFSWVEPCQPKKPKLLTWSPALGKSLGWSPDFCQSALFLDWMSGKKLPQHCRSFATNYAGHQFGHWAGQLGDGRAIMIGQTSCVDTCEQIFGVSTPKNTVSLQLKGAGATPYARFADGKAVLRSSLREYVCSEAMAALGVPTTRALSLSLTGASVPRDPLYTGNIIDEPGAVVCRVAPSFFRFGHIELLSFRGQHDALKALIDFLIETETAQLLEKKINPQEQVIFWFEITAKRTLEMLMHWMRIGFVHGVMNTDNFSTLGLTIDYGPFGFLSAFDGYWTPNTTDIPGRRYTYGNQIAICLWNLTRLAHALRPLTKRLEPFNEILQDITQQANSQWRILWQKKIGLPATLSSSICAPLVQELLDLMQQAPLDMTVFFRQLANFNEHDLPQSLPQTAQAATQWLLSLPWHKAYLTANESEFYSESPKLAQMTYDWLSKYRRITQESDCDFEKKSNRMNQENPVIVPRYELLQSAITQIEQSGETTQLARLMDALSQPYTAFDQFDDLYQPPKTHEPLKACLSCSS